MTTKDGPREAPIAGSMIPPRIVMVAHEIHQRGGMERVMYERISRLSDSYAFTVIARELSPELQNLVTWQRVAAPKKPFPMKFLVFFVIAAFRLLKWRGAIVHTCGAIVPNRITIASVHHCHAAAVITGGEATGEAPLWRRWNHMISRRLAVSAERWSYTPTRTNTLAADSDRVVREIELHYPGMPVILTPNGVDSDRFRPDAAVRSKVRRANGANEHSIVCLFVGGDWSRKGVDIAIKALGTLTASDDPVLWIVGRGDKKRYERLAAEVGVLDRVQFFGTVPDVTPFYQAADVLLLPSAYEGFSLVALEALACGLPVVATDVGVTGQLLREGLAGILVGRSPDEFGEAIERLCERSLRKTMAREARRIAKAYSWEASAAAVDLAYKSLLGLGTGARP